MRGLVPYAYDPTQDDGELDEEDWLHDPNAGLTDPQTRSPPAEACVPAPKKKQVWMGPDGPYHGDLVCNAGCMSYIVNKQLVLSGTESEKWDLFRNS